MSDVKRDFKVGDYVRVWDGYSWSYHYVSPHDLDIRAIPTGMHNETAWIDSWELVPIENTELKPGMTLAFHPNIAMEPGPVRFGGGYTYLITDTGADKLSRVDFTSP